MKKNKQFIALIICGSLAIILLLIGIVFYIKHKDQGEIIGTEKIKINYSASGQVDVLTQPSPKENIVLSTLPDTKDFLTEIDFKTLRKLFQTNKKSILTISSDNCTNCNSFESKIIEALEENKVTAYKINISDYNEEEIKKYIEYEGCPTTYIIENGKVSHSFKGDTDKETISAFIEYFYVRTN